MMNDPQTPTPSRAGRAFRWILGGMAGLFGLFVLAAVIGKPGPKRPVKADSARGEVTFSHSLVLPVRKADEADFSDETLEVRVEVFRDEATGNAVYLSRPNPSRKGSAVSVASGAAR